MTSFEDLTIIDFYDSGVLVESQDTIGTTYYEGIEYSYPALASRILAQYKELLASGLSVDEVDVELRKNLRSITPEWQPSILNYIEEIGKAYVASSGGGGAVTTKKKKKKKTPPPPTPLGTWPRTITFSDIVAVLAVLPAWLVGTMDFTISPISYVYNGKTHNLREENEWMNFFRSSVQELTDGDVGSNFTSLLDFMDGLQAVIVAKMSDMGPFPIGWVYKWELMVASVADVIQGGSSGQYSTEREVMYDLCKDNTDIMSSMTYTFPPVGEVVVLADNRKQLLEYLSKIIYREDVTPKQVPSFDYGVEEQLVFKSNSPFKPQHMDQYQSPDQPSPKKTPTKSPPKKKQPHLTGGTSGSPVETSAAFFEIISEKLLSGQKAFRPYEYFMQIFRPYLGNEKAIVGELNFMNSFNTVYLTNLVNRILYVRYADAPDVMAISVMCESVLFVNYLSRTTKYIIPDNVASMTDALDIFLNILFDVHMISLVCTEYPQKISTVLEEILRKINSISAGTGGALSKLLKGDTVNIHQFGKDKKIAKGVDSILDLLPEPISGIDPSLSLEIHSFSEYAIADVSHESVLEIMSGILIPAMAAVFSSDIIIGSHRTAMIPIRSCKELLLAVKDNVFLPEDVTSLLTYICTIYPACQISRVNTAVKNATGLVDNVSWKAFRKSLNVLGTISTNIQDAIIEPSITRRLLIQDAMKVKDTPDKPYQFAVLEFLVGNMKTPIASLLNMLFCIFTSFGEAVSTLDMLDALKLKKDDYSSTLTDIHRYFIDMAGAVLIESVNKNAVMFDIFLVRFFKEAEKIYENLSLESKKSTIGKIAMCSHVCKPALESGDRNYVRKFCRFVSRALFGTMALYKVDGVVPELLYKLSILDVKKIMDTFKKMLNLMFRAGEFITNDVKLDHIGDGGVVYSTVFPLLGDYVLKGLVSELKDEHFKSYNNLMEDPIFVGKLLYAYTNNVALDIADGMFKGLFKYKSLQNIYIKRAVVIDYWLLKVDATETLNIRPLEAGYIQTCINFIRELESALMTITGQAYYTIQLWRGLESMTARWHSNAAFYAITTLDKEHIYKFSLLMLSYKGEMGVNESWVYVTNLKGMELDAKKRDVLKGFGEQFAQASVVVHENGTDPKEVDTAAIHPQIACSETFNPSAMEYFLIARTIMENNYIRRLREWLEVFRENFFAHTVVPSVLKHELESTAYYYWKSIVGHHVTSNSADGRDVENMKESVFRNGVDQLLVSDTTYKERPLFALLGTTDRTNEMFGNIKGIGPNLTSPTTFRKIYRFILNIIKLALLGEVDLGDYGLSDKFNQLRLSSGLFKATASEVYSNSMTEIAQNFTDAFKKEYVAKVKLSNAASIVNRNMNLSPTLPNAYEAIVAEKTPKTMDISNKLRVATYTTLGTEWAKVAKKLYAALASIFIKEKDVLNGTSEYTINGKTYRMSEDDAAFKGHLYEYIDSKFDEENTKLSVLIDKEMHKETGFSSVFDVVTNEVEKVILSWVEVDSMVMEGAKSLGGTDPVKNFDKLPESIRDKYVFYGKLKASMTSSPTASQFTSDYTQSQVKVETQTYSGGEHKYHKGVSSVGGGVRRKTTKIGIKHTEASSGMGIKNIFSDEDDINEDISNLNSTTDIRSTGLPAPVIAGLALSPINLSMSATKTDYSGCEKEDLGPSESVKSNQAPSGSPKTYESSNTHKKPPSKNTRFKHVEALNI